MILKDLIEIKQDNNESNSEDEKDDKESSKLTVTFLSVILINEYIITGGDDGFVII